MPREAVKRATNSVFREKLWHVTVATAHVNTKLLSGLIFDRTFSAHGFTLHGTRVTYTYTADGARHHGTRQKASPGSEIVSCAGG